MNKQEKIKLVQLLFYEEQRLKSDIDNCSYRYVRRDLDSIDLLEEIISKENYNYFLGLSTRIIKLLSLSEEDN